MHIEGNILLLTVSVRGSLTIVLPVPVKGTVHLGVGGVPGGMADVALVFTQPRAVHQAIGVSVPGADKGQICFILKNCFIKKIEMLSRNVFFSVG